MKILWNSDRRKKWFITLPSPFSGCLDGMSSSGSISASFLVSWFILSCFLLAKFAYPKDACDSLAPLYVQTNAGKRYPLERKFRNAQQGNDSIHPFYVPSMWKWQIYGTSCQFWRDSSLPPLTLRPLRSIMKKPDLSNSWRNSVLNMSLSGVCICIGLLFPQWI